MNRFDRLVLETIEEFRLMREIIDAIERGDRDAADALRLILADLFY